MLGPRPLPPGFIVPCLPTPANQCKSGPAWVHEIKHDGYRMIARRNGDRACGSTRARGFNGYPRMVDALRSLRGPTLVAAAADHRWISTRVKSEPAKLHGPSSTAVKACSC
jgi:hypothetical protein